MNKYTDEKNAQIVLALLKAHGIKKIIASPGTTNIALVVSAQKDSFFEMYSAIDERHAAYMACGLSAESCEPVVISCTGATASRNYFPALTEAYYRKLPVLAITSMQDFKHTGNLYPQWLERDAHPSDTVRISVSCPTVETIEDARDCELKVNRAILELKRRGGGPAHINLETKNVGDFNTTVLPNVRKIDRITAWNHSWPELEHFKRIVVWITSHKPFPKQELDAIERFVVSRDAVVLSDITGSFHGRGVIHASILAAQGIRSNPKYAHLMPDLIIHIGGVTGDYPTRDMLYQKCPVWRVSEDGEVVDSLSALTHVFEMPEDAFFNRYATQEETSLSFYRQWENAVFELRNKLPDLPFSNLWIAKEFCAKVPNDCVVHAAILSSLRSINYMGGLHKVEAMSNVGGFGIDGCLSAMIGASLANPGKLHFIMIGDMSFFYDMNSMGNRHIGKNLRILVNRNGISGEMYMPISIGSRLGEDAREYVCSDRHFGNLARTLIKDYAENLGFKYFKAETKDEFKECLPDFVSESSDVPVVLECFTDPKIERQALYDVMHIEKYERPRRIKEVIKDALPGRVKLAIKDFCK